MDASRTELMNAMLYYFIGCSISLSEIGDLSLDKILDPRVHNFGLHEDDPIPIYTSRNRFECASSTSPAALPEAKSVWRTRL